MTQSKQLKECRIDQYEDSIEALPDKIENQAQWLKAQFDARSNKEIRHKHNDLVELLTEYGVQNTVCSEKIREIRLNAHQQLEVKKDTELWEIAGSGGHLMMTPDGRVLPMRSHLAFRGEVEMQDDAQQDATVIFGVKGEQGNTGVITQLNPGMFALSVENDGHLYLSHHEQDYAPPLKIENGHLIYEIQE